MKQFINLSTRVINKLHIIEIVKKPNNYTIVMSMSHIHGWLLFSSGNLETDSNIIDICEKNNKHDYDIITKFIEKVQDTSYIYK